MKQRGRGDRLLESAPRRRHWSAGVRMVDKR